MFPLSSVLNEQIENVAEGTAFFYEHLQGHQENAGITTPGIWAVAIVNSYIAD